jgi:hypothetical protein
LYCPAGGTQGRPGVRTVGFLLRGETFLVYRREK